MCRELLAESPLDRAMEFGNFLEERTIGGHPFVRYELGTDLLGDSITGWYCKWCGEAADPDETAGRCQYCEEEE